MKSIQAFATLLALLPLLPVSAQQPAAATPGVYRCIASKFRNGTLETMPRGSVTLGKDGRYTYRGFEKPSEGRWKQQGSSVALSGGYLDGGEARPIDGSANRYHLVFPTNPDNRWSCGLDTRP